MAKQRGSRPEAVGQRIRERREQRGIQQQELAAMAGIDQSTLSQIETGKTKNPEAGTILNVAAALQVSPYLLVFDHIPPAAMQHTIAAMVEVWDRLTDRQRLQVIAYAQGLIDASGKQRPDPQPDPRPRNPRDH
jgi:transcriptional regulator with XRE-family HTH domain